MSDLTNQNEMESLEFPCDPSTLPTSAELPLGDLILEIKSIKVGKTKDADGSINERTGKLKVGGKKMVTVQFGLSEPSELAGLPHTKNFLIGSDEDAEAKKPGTWQRNATLLMAMFKGAKVGGKTFAEYAAAAPGQRVGATIKTEKSKDPQYPDKNTPKAFWEPGSRPVKVIEMGADLDKAFSGPTPTPPAFENND